MQVFNVDWGKIVTEVPVRTVVWGKIVTAVPVCPVPGLGLNINCSASSYCGLG